MLTIPANIAHRYDTELERQSIAADYRPHYRKWFRFYMEFCHKYGFDNGDKNSFRHYNNKLKEKDQPESL